MRRCITYRPVHPAAEAAVINAVVNVLVEMRSCDCSLFSDAYYFRRARHRPAALNQAVAYLGGGGVPATAPLGAGNFFSLWVVALNHRLKRYWGAVRQFLMGRLCDRPPPPIGFPGKREERKNE
jgi:hypothetical protein